ncbi:4a-hydroxytetrahydrobiopterin dehydratase [Candidatus Endobugula sertula]|uniref:Putative pterin-4-alpha-carbinolamine dehydratase n=1 Tax=Candidatus Endobugula sertula TaxID=62101 RepID=A0A1D2QPD9_9GAMM|nr:4a-hydroxytetrahydrobiopterin dehydratase [Candidatus Endobugula sertula]
MSDLSQQKCEACRTDAPRVNGEEIQQLLSLLDGWQIVNKKNVLQLLKVYPCKNFVTAIEFANKIAELAEEAGHHPALLVEWGRVTVRWWTHKISGLHKNDFIMAARTDSQFES